MNASSFAVRLLLAACMCLVFGAQVAAGLAATPQHRQAAVDQASAQLDYIQALAQQARQNMP